MHALYRLVRSLLVVYAALILVAAGFVMAELKLHHGRLLTVQTGSMAPVFYPGDALIISPLVGPIRPGIVVSYISPVNGRVVSHRVMAVDNARQQLTTRGDHVATPDTPLPNSVVIGQVRYILPHLGKLLDFLHRPLGLTLFLYVPAFAVVMGEIRRLTKAYGRGRYTFPGYR